MQKANILFISEKIALYPPNFANLSQKMLWHFI